MHSSNLSDFSTVKVLRYTVRRWVGGVWWVVAKAKTKKQDGTMLEFRVAMTSICTHKRSVFHYKN